MARAEYNHSVHEEQLHKVISIVDLCMPNVTTVTNDIENVVEEICKHRRIHASDHIIVYRNTDKSWDGFDAGIGEIVPLGATSRGYAVHSMIKMKTPGTAT